MIVEMFLQKIARMKFVMDIMDVISAHDYFGSPAPGTAPCGNEAISATYWCLVSLVLG